jgi:hypothetical protein
MTNEPEKNGAMSAIILVVIIIVVALYTTTYGMQTLQWIAAHRWAENDPWLNDVPQPLAATAVPAVPAPTMSMMAMTPKSKTAKISLQPTNTQLSAYQWQFTVPWMGKFKEGASAGGAEFRFASGQVVIFGDPEAQLDTLEILRTSQSAEYAPFQSLVNDAGITTNYALFKAVYGASPSQVKPLTNYAVAQQDRVLLLTKLSFGFDLEKTVYSFDFGDKKGFQFGDPAGGPVALRVFNDKDHQFRFLFTVANGSGAQIKQDDINQAIQSLQPEAMETR